MDGEMQFLSVPEIGGSTTPSEYLSDDSDVIATQCLLPRSSESPETNKIAAGDGSEAAIDGENDSNVTELTRDEGEGCLDIKGEGLEERESPECPPPLGVQNTYMTLGAGVVEALSCSEKPTVDMALVKWPWKAIRRFCKLLGGTVLTAMLCVVVAMIITMPKKCDPELAWWQGQAFYQIYPASFQDSNGDGIGDFRGLMSRLDYIKSLGVVAIHLGSIFTARNSTLSDTLNFTHPDPRLGSLYDFNSLMVEARVGNIKVVLDVPMSDMLESVDSLSGWLRMGVFGFSLVTDTTGSLDKDDIIDIITSTRQLLDRFTSGDQHRILICPADVFQLQNFTQGEDKIMKSMCDMIHLKLDESGLESQLNRSWKLSGSENSPWILWNSDEQFVTESLKNNWRSILIQAMFPGSMNVFSSDKLSQDNKQDEVPVSWLGRDGNGTSLLTTAIKLKSEEIPLHIKGIFHSIGEYHPKESKNYVIKKCNCGGIFIMERYYPRRFRYILLANEGSHTVTCSLSHLYYGGLVQVSTETVRQGYITFRDLILAAKEVMIVRLDM